MSKVIFKNSFGIIDQEKVTIYSKKDIITIPITKIDMLEVKRVRNWFFAILGFTVALTTIIIGLPKNTSSPEALVGLIIFTIIVFLVGLANYIGHHEITLHGENLEHKIKIEMSKTREGQEFYSALKGVVY